MEILGFAAGPYKTNCYLAIADKKVTVIDPGMHAAAHIDRHLLDNDLILEQIILTHGHIDHTRDAGTLALKHQVPVYIHPADEFMLAAGEGVSPESQILFDAAHMTPIKQLFHLNHGEHISLGEQKFEVRHAPGHSPGSVLFVSDEFCFSGDVVFKGSIGRTDLAQSNPKDMQRSLQEQVLTLDDRLQILPGHGPITTMRAERMTNPFLR
ncbi:Metallo-beta-lactamase superfamily protein [Corynebacterium kutscheri]|uniref:Metallo-beta-lactamase superfamily protein n=1 Tax=Corynebacterium kutscheri TaxID=35755 RepID=A0A0F6TDK4_9CORY|nr:MBL fold metallo-hydrolase [Corynebacterium kutscheri]AKE41334.1 Zn-dependent hydrolase, glyoxylase [Corynebacterium kutscheri]VEH08610.1 Metallo-beta-lactamase superfamily protein [Corynebacterium kutscheri]VEH09656.1 Metallo-beta-lactamase superfamily protein [Corynebacterium kutscheri]VEH79739.1 Metallo-beta-lactamase superfamily protein [Corynebacterium kutscheri]